MPTSPLRMRTVPVPDRADGDAASRLARLRSGALNGLVARASDHTGHRPAADRVLPVLPELRELLPEGGLRRGSAIALGGPQRGGATPPQASTLAGQPATVGVTSLLTALLVGPSQAGSWCAVVGMPAFGTVAAAEAGVCLDRLALVPCPGTEWASVVAALLDGVDVVAVQGTGQTQVTGAVAHRLAARARQRGGVLMPVGTWPGADMTMTPHLIRDLGAGRPSGGEHNLWEGAGQGRGRLRRRKVEVVAWGRGSGARFRRTRLWLPADNGGVAEVAGLDQAVTPEAVTPEAVTPEAVTPEVTASVPATPLVEGYPRDLVCDHRHTRSTARYATSAARRGSGVT